jgi:hypothetical protein
MLCGDGTIRNSAINFCFTPANTDGTGDVSSSSCDLLTNYDFQKWTFGRNKTFTDVGGVN